VDNPGDLPVETIPTSCRLERIAALLLSAPKNIRNTLSKRGAAQPFGRLHLAFAVKISTSPTNKPSETQTEGIKSAWINKFPTRDSLLFTPEEWQPLAGG
jgi:hypothetical protein